jgi:hypothetical protein
MPIAVACGQCGSQFNAPDSAHGRRAKCPKCSGLILISKNAVGESQAEQSTRRPVPAIATDAKPLTRRPPPEAGARPQAPPIAASPPEQTAIKQDRAPITSSVPEPEPKASANPSHSIKQRFGKRYVLVSAGLAGATIVLLGVAAVWHYRRIAPPAVALDGPPPTADHGPVEALVNRPKSDKAVETVPAPLPTTTPATSAAIALPDQSTVESSIGKAPTADQTEQASAPLPVVEPKKSLGMELPPVSPRTPISATDSEITEFKQARAACAEARKRARLELQASCASKVAEIKKGALPPDEKSKLITQIQDDKLAFLNRHYDGPRPIYNSSAMKAETAEYSRKIREALSAFGAVADKGLASYEQQGVTDTEKLQPLRSASLAGQHPEFIGIWARLLPKREWEIWLIDVDENSGGWIVGGLNQGPNYAPRISIHGEKIVCKGKTLRCSAKTTDLRNSKKKPVSSPVSFQIHEDQLRLKCREGTKTVTVTLDRIDLESTRYWLNGYAGKSPARDKLDNVVAKELDLSDTDSVWRHLASLTSSGYYRGGNRGPGLSERLYIPYRSRHLTLNPDPKAGAIDLIAGNAPGADVNHDLTKSLLSQFDSIVDPTHPYLKRASEQAYSLCRYRLRLALADEKFGNTPASSIRNFQQSVLLPAMKFAFSREADRAAVKKSLQEQYPGYIVIVTDVPMSEASQQKLQTFVSGLANLKSDVELRSIVSGLLAYSDMAVADQTATFWQTWLMPLAKRSAGPESKDPLVRIDAVWRTAAIKERTQRLSYFSLQNIAKQDLTHAVVQVVAENPWGEIADHYYYFPTLETAESVLLVPNPRWEERRLNFTNYLKVTCNIWADQGSFAGQPVKLDSPAPYPDPEGYRRDALRFDTQCQAEGEALGAVMQATLPLPDDPAGKQRRLRAAMATGTNYAFRQGAGDSARTLLLRFVRCDPGSDEIDAEIVDPKDGKPLPNSPPVWKGQLDPAGNPIVVFGAIPGLEQSSWSCSLESDDSMRIRCASAGAPGAVFPDKEIQIFRVSSP